MKKRDTDLWLIKNKSGGRGKVSTRCTPKTSQYYTKNSATTQSWPVINNKFYQYEYDALFSLNNNNSSCDEGGGVAPSGDSEQTGEEDNEEGGVSSNSRKRVGFGVGGIEDSLSEKSFKSSCSEYNFSRNNIMQQQSQTAATTTNNSSSCSAPTPVIFLLVTLGERYFFFWFWINCMFNLPPSSIYFFKP